MGRDVKAASKLRPYRGLLLVILVICIGIPLSYRYVRNVARRDIATDAELRMFVPGTESIATNALNRMLADNSLGTHPAIPLKYRIPDDMPEQEFEEVARLILKDYLSGVDVAMGSLDQNNQYVRGGYTEHQPYGDPRQAEIYISLASATDMQYERYPELPSESLLDYLAEDGFKVRPGPEVRNLSTWKEYDQGDQPYYALLTLWGIERAGREGYKAILIFRTPDYIEQLMVDISQAAADGKRELLWEQLTTGCG
ncbi:hypothetical protein KDL44_12855 [bacterium]|nr:hypothetical protein [bacterium]